MRNRLCFMALILISNTVLFAQSAEDVYKTTGLSHRIIKAIENGKIFSKSKVVDSVNKENIKNQQLDFKIAGLHKKSCRPVLRKLSLYENYTQYLDFVKKSQYDKQNKRVRFKLSSNILPIKMYLDFKLPRIKTIGSYPFLFDKGFLRGLTGIINIYSIKNRCFFYTTAHWKGRHTKFPNIIFEFFSSTLSKLAMENLFRISQTL